MNLIVERDRADGRKLDSHAKPMPTLPDHDLPLLALEHSPRVRIDWESLMDDGMQPSLVLGAERRLRGSRS